MAKIKLVKFDDPGHGWLQVPSKLVKELGLHDCISEFSYISPSGAHSYLEHDDDAPKALKKIKDAGYEVSIDFRTTNKNSHIRRYRRHDCLI
jgi:hypothetical protein